MSLITVKCDGGCCTAQYIGPSWDKFPAHAIEEARAEGWLCDGPEVPNPKRTDLCPKCRYDKPSGD